MPLTDFQRALLAVLAAAPTDERYLAGGAALHFAPHSARYSDDLDFFHDSEARVATAFAADRARLAAAGYAVEVELSQPGFVRAIVRKGDGATSRATSWISTMSIGTSSRSADSSGRRLGRTPGSHRSPSSSS